MAKLYLTLRNGISALGYALYNSHQQRVWKCDLEAYNLKLNYHYFIYIRQNLERTFLLNIF